MSPMIVIGVDCLYGNTRFGAWDCFGAPDGYPLRGFLEGVFFCIYTQLAWNIVSQSLECLVVNTSI